MTNRFAAVPKADISRSSFDRSHGHKTTIDGGVLYPVFLDEVLPGDTFNLKMHAIGRLATPIFPIMDNIYLDTQFFFVPYRLVWDNWAKFNGEQTNPGDSTDYTIPQLTGIHPPGELGDYFGLPASVSSQSVNSLPFRAYNLIWHEWYRDQNLQLAPGITVADGPDTVDGNFYLRRRGKRHDYFTSCLPWPQKGPSASVTIVPDMAGAAPTFVNAGTAGPTRLATSSGTKDVLISNPSATASANLEWADPNLMATVNDLRNAVQVQRLLERDARGGTRYTELIRSHFGVTSPDARLQRPEYLGGFSQPINISQIHQTQATSAGVTPLGQVGAIGTVQLDGNRNGFTQSFTEHGCIIGLASVRADMTYQQRLDRMWTRATRFDFFWPALAHIGEQAVLNKELYWSGTPATDDAVFGYQERYAEYRYKPSQVTGIFRSASVAPLDAWHLAFDFAATPVLNATFIQEDPPLDRVVATPTEPKVILDCWFELQCARPMPMYGVPGMMDHF